LLIHKTTKLKLLPLFVVTIHMTLVRAKVVITHVTVYWVVLYFFATTTAWNRHIHVIIWYIYRSSIIMYLLTMLNGVYIGSKAERNIYGGIPRTNW